MPLLAPRLNIPQAAPQAAPQPAPATNYVQPQAAPQVYGAPVAAASNAYETAVNQNTGVIPQSYQGIYDPSKLGPVTGNTLAQSVAAQPTNPLSMIKATPQSALNAFFQLPEYQLLFNSNNPATMNPNATIADRFTADPGYQYMQDEGMKQIQRNASAKGLLNSGSMMRDLSQYGTNLANQSFEQFRNRMSNTYTGYQDRLLQLMGFGSGFNGSNQDIATGNTLSGLTTGTGNNISSLQQALGQNVMNSNLTTSGNASNALTQLASTQASANAQRDIGAAQSAATVAAANAQAQASVIGSALSFAGGFF